MLCEVSPPHCFQLTPAVMAQRPLRPASGADGARRVPGLCTASRRVVGCRLAVVTEALPAPTTDNRAPTTAKAAGATIPAMIRFEDILDKVESYKPDFDEELLDRAFVF